MKKTQEKRAGARENRNAKQKQANGVRASYKRPLFTISVAGILVIVFLLGYAASHCDAPKTIKRLLIQPQQPKEVLKIAICQYGTRIGALEWNLQHAIDWAEEAFEQGADYVILPEFSFSGLNDLSYLHDLITEFEQIDGEETLRKVARHNRGYLQYNHPARTDNTFWNETVLLDPNGTVVTRYHKRYLAVIDQIVKFENGRTPTVIDLPFGRIGFLICRDVIEAEIVEQGLLPESTAADTNIYKNACQNLEQYRQADLIVGQLAFASWWTPTRRNPIIKDSIADALYRMEEEAEVWARQTRTYIALVNKSGFEHGHGYTGGSLLVDPSGKILAQASSGDEIIFIDLPLDETGRIARPNQTLQSVDINGSKPHITPSEIFN